MEYEDWPSKRAQWNMMCLNAEAHDLRMTIQHLETLIASDDLEEWEKRAHRITLSDTTKQLMLILPCLAKAEREYASFQKGG